MEELKFLAHKQDNALVNQAKATLPEGAVGMFNVNSDGKNTFAYYTKFPDIEPLQVMLAFEDQVVNLTSWAREEGVEFIHSPKLFTFGAETWFSVHNNSSSMYVGRVNDLTGPTTLIRCEYEDAQIQEKNWAFYQRGENVFALYSIDPLVVLKRVAVSEDPHVWTFERIEGPNAPTGTGLHVGTNLIQNQDGSYFGIASKLIRPGMKVAHFPVKYVYEHASSVIVEEQAYAHNLEATIGMPRGVYAPRRMVSATFPMSIHKNDEGKVVFWYGVNDSVFSAVVL